MCFVGVVMTAGNSFRSRATRPDTTASLSVLQKKWRRLQSLALQKLFIMFARMAKSYSLSFRGYPPSRPRKIDSHEKKQKPQIMRALEKTRLGYIVQDDSCQER